VTAAVPVPARERRSSIRRACGRDAAALTDLALRSKAVWGYDAAFIDACRDELRLSPDEVERHPTYLLEDRGQPLGHYQLRLRALTADVWHFFVAPNAIRRGVGRRLWAHLEDTARVAGALRLEVDSDPHAEGFYVAMGMRRVGEAASGSIPGRLLPHLARELAPERSGRRRDNAAAIGFDAGRS
jgi:GNAT superfamily N-acetyltransferase